MVIVRDVGWGEMRGMQHNKGWIYQLINEGFDGSYKGVAAAASGGLINNNECIPSMATALDASLGIICDGASSRLSSPSSGFPVFYPPINQSCSPTPIYLSIYLSIYILTIYRYIYIYIYIYIYTIYLPIYLSPLLASCMYRPS